MRSLDNLPEENVRSASPRSENEDIRTQELQDGVSEAFDQELLARIGNRIALRRSLCRLSEQQLGARLGIDAADVSAHERGEKRMSCKLLFETAKHLKTALRFFFFQ
jgi:hypothetical protein